MALGFGVPDPVRGQTVTAAVVPSDGAELDVDQLSQLTNRQLSAYKVPTRWLVLHADEVPFLASGKPNKRALVDRCGPGFHRNEKTAGSPAC
jgi:acyl-CoA synthetase (AMP-forming)/AMP-acid ligase II